MLPALVVSGALRRPDGRGPGGLGGEGLGRLYGTAAGCQASDDLAVGSEQNPGGWKDPALWGVDGIRSSVDWSMGFEEVRDLSTLDGLLAVAPPQASGPAERKEIPNRFVSRPGSCSSRARVAVEFRHDSGSHRWLNGTVSPRAGTWPEPESSLPARGPQHMRARQCH